METRDRILEFVKSKGPVLPVQVSKDINSDILMASAHLAELTASSRLRISSIKVGGSPLYYLPGQEAMLEKYASNLNEKEKKAFDLLNQNKVLRDSEQTPVTRVALRAIKDFAMPLNVNYNSNKEIFWKWHTATDKEAEQLIKSKLEIKQEIAQSIEVPKPAPADQQISRETEAGPAIKAQALQQTAETALQALQKQEIKQQQLPKEKRAKKAEKEDAFLKDIMKFFQKSNVSVISSELVKKNSEIDFVIEMQSVMGMLKYYCKAKNKKKINDADLSSAYVKGQFKKLPVIFISTGDLLPKAAEMIGRELGSLTFKKI